jgi:putative phosphoesterase
MIGVIADIHSNLPALEAVLEDLDKKKVEEVICLGDVVGYGAYPNECCEIIKKRHINCVMGNHDFAAATGMVWAWFGPDAKKAIEWTNKKLTMENKMFLSVLPKRLTLDFKGVKVGLVHGSPVGELFEYIEPTTTDSTLKKFMEQMNCQILAFGHTHLSFAKLVGTGLVFNPGSVGQPRDNNPMASYVLLEPETMKISLCRKGYDVETAAMEMKIAHLPDFLWERLYEGL